MHDHFTRAPLPPADRLGTLLDVTLRDGGFELDFHWPNDVFSTLPTALAPLGVDVVELGYVGGVPLEHSVARPGVGAFLTAEHVAAARRPGLELAAMMHPSALDEPPDLEPYVAAGLTMLRLVYHPAWAANIATLARHARGLGLVTTVNIALASRYELAELCTHAAAMTESAKPDVVYVADTCSALLPDQVHRLVSQLVNQLSGAGGVRIGFHAHDFLGLAYANTLAAVHAGATYVDCSVLGLGRGSGNLAAEPVLLRHRLSQQLPLADLGGLLECRDRLAEVTGRPRPSLVPMACAALNMTPVEERALREFADEEEIDVELAALWAVTAHSQLSSLRAGDLRAAWTAAKAERG